MIIAHSRGLAVCSPNANGSIKGINGELELNDIKGITAFGGFIYAWRSGDVVEVVKISKELEIISSRQFHSIGSMASHGKHLLIGAETSLVALDTSLKETGRVSFFKNRPFKKDKNVHDIIVYENLAYLLDNIEEPVYCFKVDVRKPDNMKIVSDYNINDSNPHLDAHWLIPEFGQWMIAQSSRSSRGWYQYVHCIDMGIKSNKPRSWEMHKLTVGEGEGIAEWEESGLPVKGALLMPDIWIISRTAEIESGNIKKYRHGLLELWSDENSLYTSDQFFPIPFFDDELKDYSRFIMRRVNNLIFTAPHGGDKIVVIDISSGPRIVNVMDLSEFKIDFLADIAFFE